VKTFDRCWFYSGLSNRQNEVIEVDIGIRRWFGQNARRSEISGFPKMRSCEFRRQALSSLVV
jgi:hypothetical protein